MSFTLTAGTDTVTIHNAAFGDSRAYDDNRAVNRNRADDPKISVDSDWCELHTYVWPFERLCETDKDALLGIVKDHPGEIFEVTDHSKLVIGYIISSKITFVEGREDMWNVTIEMISVLAPDTEPYLLLEDDTYLLLEDDQKTYLESV